MAASRLPQPPYGNRLAATRPSPDTMWPLNGHHAATAAAEQTTTGHYVATRQHPTTLQPTPTMTQQRLDRYATTIHPAPTTRRLLGRNVANTQGLHDHSPQPPNNDYPAIIDYHSNGQSPLTTRQTIGIHQIHMYHSIHIHIYIYNTTLVYVIMFFIHNIGACQYTIITSKNICNNLCII